MHSTCTDHTTKAARRYVSPSSRPLTQEEAGIRALSYAIKDTRCDSYLVLAAATAMAQLIEGETGYLIPVPDHNGDTLANERLALYIAQATRTDNGKGPCRFVRRLALTRSAPVDSQCERHKRRKKPLTPEEHLIIRRPCPSITLGGPTTPRIYFVDNVITSGSTIEACRRCFSGLGTGLVYADAHYDARN